MPGRWVVDNIGVEEIHVGFDEPVTVPPGAVSAWTLEGGSVAGITTSFDGSTDILTVMFSPAVRDDRLTVVLDYSVADLAGNELDGEVLDPADAALPSGDGFRGGQAVFRINILQGDASRDGIVDETDAAIVLASLGLNEEDTAYDAEADLNHDGAVNILDVAIFALAEGRSLPVTDGMSPAISRFDLDPDTSATVTVSFNKAIAAAQFGLHSCFLIDGSDNLISPTGGNLAPDGLSASYDFAPPLVPCGGYRINVSNALADGSGALLLPVTPPPEIGIVPPSPALDPHTTMTDTSVVTITGAAEFAPSVDVFSPGGTLSVPVTGGSFSADVPLAQDQKNEIFFTAISGCASEPSAPVTTTVIQDERPPNVLVDSPADGAELTLATVNVTGRVGDLLSGLTGLTVTVNGVGASIAAGTEHDGTFVAENVPLTLGAPTLIEVVATDALGNSRTKQITVTRVDIPAGTPQMVIVSGDGQSGTAGSVLPAPIRLRMTHGDGTPFEGKVVTFEVARSDGRLFPAPPAPEEEDKAFLQVHTDVDGYAEAYWRLGSDSGPSNNEVDVTSTSIAGTILFLATGQPAPATQVSIGSGNNQQTEAGSQAPEPLRVRVTDGYNGVAGVPVTFTVVEGGGAVNALNAVTVNTGSTGHAQVNFTLGFGTEGNIVEADFPANLGLPATFVLYGLVRDESQATSCSAYVLDDTDKAIEGATCRLDVNGSTYATTLSDAQGRCFFDNITVSGPAVLHIEGPVVALAQSLEAAGIPTGFATLRQELLLVPNADNALTAPVSLPSLDPDNAVVFDNAQDVVLTVEEIEGLEFTVKAGSMMRGDGSVPGPADPETLSLNQVHFERVPIPLPDGAGPVFAWLLEPADAVFDPPVDVVLPNMPGLPAGTLVRFLALNPDTNKFDVVTTGRVTDDALAMASDPGGGLPTGGIGGYIADTPDTTTVEIAETDGSCATSDSYFYNMIEFMPLLTNPCEGIDVTDSESFDLYQACAQNSPECAEQAYDNALTLPDTFEDTPLPELEETAGDLWDAYLAMVGWEPTGPSLESGLGTPSSAALAPRPVILSQTQLSVSRQVPGSHTKGTARVLIGSPPPPQVKSGQVVAQRPVQYGTSKTSTANMKVKSVSSGQVDYDVRVVRPKNTPKQSVSVGSQHRRVQPTQIAKVPNVVVYMAHALMRPSTLWTGEGIAREVAPETHQQPNPGGTTTISVPRVTDPEPPDVLSVPRQILSTASASTISPGQTSQVTVTATLSDGSTTDRTPRSTGTYYQTSNPAVATVSDDGVVTGHQNGSVYVSAFNDGVASVTRIDVVVPTIDTTVEGFVHLDDGTPVQGATVTIFPDGTTSGSSGSDGSFSILATVPPGTSSVAVSAVISGGPLLCGAVSGLSLVVDGITDAGIIMVADQCSLPGVVYVDAGASGANDGTAWIDAYTDLQDALNDAAKSGGDVREIWVVAGIYKPAGPGGDRSATFQLLNDVAIYGGFAGWEMTRGQRDPTPNETILSGDLSGNDDPDDFPGGATFADNSYHVLTGSGTNATAMLDGFTVTGGVGFGGPSLYGGGMFTDQGDPTVRYCTFRRNSASSAGAVWNQNANPTFVGCTFDTNHGASGSAMENAPVSSPILINCIFVNNTSDNRGGAVFNNTGSVAQFINCVFSGNTAGWSGGAMINQSADPTIVNCTFSNNTGNPTGGVYNEWLDGNTSDPVISNSVFWGNSDGGGSDESAQIDSDGTGTININYSLVQGLTGSLGGVGNIDGDPLFVDFNGPDDVVGTEDDNVRLTDGSPCIDAADNTALPADSTDLDADGDTAEPVPIDIAGAPRFVDEPGTTGSGNGSPPIADMGAYEFRSVVFVDETATGTNNGTSWLNAYSNLQDALTAAQGPAGTVPEIWVAAGVYRPDQGAGQSPGDRLATFQLVDDVAVYGGFAGGETVRGQRDIGANVTTLSGDLARDDAGVSCTQDLPDCDLYGGRCVDGTCIIKLNISENSYHVTTGSGTTPSAVLDGFTITGGNANGPQDSVENQGGGMYIQTGDPTIAHCTFEHNTALSASHVGHGYGGAIMTDQGNPNITNCTFRGNIAGDRGGGLASDRSNCTIERCTFSSNAVVKKGGAVHAWAQFGGIQDSVFVRNSASDGGGLFVEGCCGSAGYVTNSLFIGNVGGRGGAIRCQNNAGAHVINCTLYANEAVEFGGGFYTENNGEAHVFNTILWNNMDGGGMDESAQVHLGENAGFFEIGFSLIQGLSLLPGDNNIGGDPVFVGPAGADGIPGTEDDDLRLSSGSPCIDAGNNGSVPGSVTTDLDGNPRFVDDPATSDTGEGTPPIVDMGGYEFQAP